MAASVFLIDCDSFQFRRNGKLFLCEVGVPTYTPPELQGKSFKNLQRSANHDNFGLAVLVFHLLFMGRHPFAGRFLGRGDMPIERAIEEHRFAFSPNASALQMAPPPSTLQMEAVSPSLAQLFERAFHRTGMQPGGRPTAKEWCLVLSAALKELQRCGRSGAHYYFKAVRSCPWCAIETATGVILFGLHVHTGSGSFSVSVVWAQIIAVPRPPAAPALPPPDPIGSKAKPSPEIQAVGRKRRIRQFGGVLIFLGAVGFMIAASVPGSAAFWLLVVSVWVAVRVAKFDDQGLRQRINVRLSSAQQTRRQVEERWHREAVNRPFDELLESLGKLRKDHADMAALRQERLSQLEKNRRSNQLQKFLEQHFIRPGEISGIGPGRVATLASYGIETANDLTRSALRNVPGFGVVLAGSLIAWRQLVESRFVFNPQKGVDPRDIQAVEKEIMAKRTEIERSLLSGPSQLQRVGSGIEHARKVLMLEYQAALAQEVQALVDSKAA